MAHRMKYEIRMTRLAHKGYKFFISDGLGKNATGKYFDSEMEAKQYASDNHYHLLTNMATTRGFHESNDTYSKMFPLLT